MEEATHQAEAGISLPTTPCVRPSGGEFSEEEILGLVEESPMETEQPGGGPPPGFPRVSTPGRIEMERTYADVCAGDQRGAAGESLCRGNYEHPVCHEECPIGHHISFRQLTDRDEVIEIAENIGVDKAAEMVEETSKVCEERHASLATRVGEVETAMERSWNAKTHQLAVKVNGQEAKTSDHEVIIQSQKITISTMARDMATYAREMAILRREVGSLKQQVDEMKIQVARTGELPGAMSGLELIQRARVVENGGQPPAASAGTADQLLARADEILESESMDVDPAEMEGRPLGFCVPAIPQHQRIPRTRKAKEAAVKRAVSCSSEHERVSLPPSDNETESSPGTGRSSERGGRSKVSTTAETASQENWVPHPEASAVGGANAVSESEHYKALMSATQARVAQMLRERPPPPPAAPSSSVPSTSAIPPSTVSLPAPTTATVASRQPPPISQPQFQDERYYGNNHQDRQPYHHSNSDQGWNYNRSRNYARGRYHQGPSYYNRSPTRSYGPRIQPLPHSTVPPPPPAPPAVTAPNPKKAKCTTALIKGTHFMEPAADENGTPLIGVQTFIPHECLGILKGMREANKLQIEAISKTKLKFPDMDHLRDSGHGHIHATITAPQFASVCGALDIFRTKLTTATTNEFMPAALVDMIQESLRSIAHFQEGVASGNLTLPAGIWT